MSTLQRDGGTAVLVIDFMQGVVSACHDVPGVTTVLATVLDRARTAGVPVIYVRQEDDSLVPGTPPWEVVPDVAPQPGDAVVSKRYWDSFAQTGLEEVLAAAGVERLVIGGAWTGACVRTTVQHAAAVGYDVTLLAGGHTSGDITEGGAVVPGSRVIAGLNQYVADLEYPGQRIEAIPAVQVAL